MRIYFNVNQAHEDGQIIIFAIGCILTFFYNLQKANELLNIVITYTGFNHRCWAHHNLILIAFTLV